MTQSVLADAGSGVARGWTNGWTTAEYEVWSYGDAGGYPTFAAGAVEHAPATRELVAAPGAREPAAWSWATPPECAAAAAQLDAVLSPDRPSGWGTALAAGVAAVWYLVTATLAR